MKAVWPDMVGSVFTPTWPQEASRSQALAQECNLQKKQPREPSVRPCVETNKKPSQTVFRCPRYRSVLPLPMSLVPPPMVGLMPSPSRCNDMAGQRARGALGNRTYVERLSGA